MVHVADVILERLDVVEIATLVLGQFTQLLLHAVTLGDQVFDNQVHVVVGSLEVDDFTIHISDLFSHLGDLLFSGPDIAFKFFDFVI